MTSDGSDRIPSAITTGLIVVTVIFSILSLAAIVLRCKARISAKQDIKADEWFIFLSWISSFALSVDVWVFAPIVGVNYIQGDTTKSVEQQSLCIWLLGRLIQIPLTLVKISILLFYKRIFSTPKFRICIWVFVAVIGCWGIVLFFMGLFMGNEFSDPWKKGAYSLRFDIVDISMASSISSLLLDVLVLCLPIPKIWKLQLKPKRKIAIVMIFWLGAFCCVAALVRIVLNYQATSTVSEDGNSIIALQWKTIIFMVLEANCSVIAACLPCMGPLFRGWRGLESIVASVRSAISLRSLRSNSTHNSQKGYNKFGDGKDPSKKAPAEESQIQLNVYAEGQGHTVDVERGSTQREDGQPGEENDGIEVAKTFEITRQ